MKITTLEKVFNRVDELSQNCFDQNVYVKDISFEMVHTMLHMVNTYTKASQMEGLPAESSYRLQKVGGEVLGMLN